MQKVFSQILPGVQILRGVVITIPWPSLTFVYHCPSWVDFCWAQFCTQDSPSFHHFIGYPTLKTSIDLSWFTSPFGPHCKSTHKFCSCKLCSVWESGVEKLSFFFCFLLAIWCKSSLSPCLKKTPFSWKWFRDRELLDLGLVTSQHCGERWMHT